MSNIFRKYAYIFVIIPVLLLVFTAALYAQAPLIPAKVKDISDRAYEPAVIELLDGAKKSIVVSMYFLSIGTKYNNPMRLLLNDIVEARERGVEVTVYLNTRFKGMEVGDTKVTESPAVKILEDAGCIIHFISYYRRLHDKLIIVDGRYVVEASTNWSISALRDNYESATLIDSPGLATIKLARLASITKPRDSPDKKPERELYTKNLPKEIALPQTLITDKKYFPKLVKRRAGRPMTLYLLLTAYGQSIEKRDFFIDQGAMGLSMGLPESWSNVTLRRQVILNLRYLKKRGYINVKFFYNKDAWVELIDIPGDTFTIDSEIIAKEGLSVPMKFYLMAQAYLELQGVDISTLSSSQLKKRVHMSQSSIHRVRKELRKRSKRGK